MPLNELPDPADKQWTRKFELELNLTALRTTLYLIAFVACVCGVFGAWR